MINICSIWNTTQYFGVYRAVKYVVSCLNSHIDPLKAVCKCGYFKFWKSRGVLDPNVIRSLIYL